MTTQTTKTSLHGFVVRGCEDLQGLNIVAQPTFLRVDPWHLPIAGDLVRRQQGTMFITALVAKSSLDANMLHHCEARMPEKGDARCGRTAIDGCRILPSCNLHAVWSRKSVYPIQKRCSCSTRTPTADRATDERTMGLLTTANQPQLK